MSLPDKDIEEFWITFKCCLKNVFKEYKININIEESRVSITKIIDNLRPYEVVESDVNNLEDLKPLISFGSSPRGSINLAQAAKCHAVIQRRGYVIPEDIKAVIHDVLRHRIGLTYEAEAENISSTDIIDKIVNSVEVP